MFPLLNSGAKFYQSDIFLFKYLEKKDNKRFCFSISKKVAKKAVLRNRLRRWGYDGVRTYLEGIKNNVIILFVYKKIPKNKDEVLENIKYLLNKNKLITK